MSGPCNIRYAEPLFLVASAADARTGAVLPQVLLRSYAFEGNPDLGTAFLIDVYGLTPRNVRAEGGALVCAVACGFGAAEGRYSLTFGAAGYRDTTFAVEARFAWGEGSCPRTLSGGRTIRLVLTPS